MFLNFSTDGKNWTIYWCEINGYFIDFKTTDKGDVFASIHLGFVDCRPAADKTDHPDIIEFFGTHVPCTGTLFYVYSYETFEFVKFFENALNAHAQFEANVALLAPKEIEIFVKPKIILSLRQKWKITKDEIYIDKTESVHYPLSDIEQLVPLINHSMPSHFLYKSKHTEAVVSEKCFSIDDMKAFVDACYTNVAINSRVVK